MFYLFQEFVWNPFCKRDRAMTYVDWERRKLGASFHSAIVGESQRILGRLDSTGAMAHPAFQPFSWPPMTQPSSTWDAQHYQLLEESFRFHWPRLWAEEAQLNTMQPSKNAEKRRGERLAVGRKWPRAQDGRPLPPGQEGWGAPLNQGSFAHLVSLYFVWLCTVLVTSLEIFVKIRRHSQVSLQSNCSAPQCLTVWCSCLHHLLKDGGQKGYPTEAEGLSDCFPEL